MVRIFRGKIPINTLKTLTARRKRRGLSMDSIGWRFELYRTHLHLQSQEMAKLLSISQGSFSDLQRDISEPSCQTIISLYKLHKDPLDVQWLLTGRSTIE